MRFIFFIVVLLVLGIVGTLGIYLRFLFVLLSLGLHFLREFFVYLVGFPALIPQEEKPFDE